MMRVDDNDAYLLSLPSSTGIKNNDKEGKKELREREREMKGKK